MPKHAPDTIRKLALVALSLDLIVLSTGCGSEDDTSIDPGTSDLERDARPSLPANEEALPGDEGGDGAAGDRAASDGAGASSTEESPDFVDFGIEEPEEDDIGVVCAAQAAASELQRVYLAFAFDVSASMWLPVTQQDVVDNRRAELKWQPIVSASEAFFAEPDSAAVSASLTFFPSGAQDVRCNSDMYVQPQVSQTLLPSSAFGDAIANVSFDQMTQAATPTLAAFTGTAASLDAIEDAGANVIKAIVLVTDGVPQQCDGDASNLNNVARAVADSGIRTYVIGVQNIPGLAGEGQGNLQNLDVIAQAGGTERAFIVETGDPTQTEADFKAVIDGIRGVSVSCNIEIPLPPAGSEFVPEKVNVTYSSSSIDAIEMSYDPSCAGPDTWRYDDDAQPSTIVLCDAACGTVQRDVTASIMVEFGCARRDVVR